VSRAATAAVAVGGAVVVVAGTLAVVFGVVGIGQTVTAGTQPIVCGVRVGVASSDQSVRLLGVSDEQHAPGDRVRVSDLCVVEIVGIDDQADAADEDGAGARVQLWWRLW